MEELEMMCFQIITNVGSAKSSYIEAIQFAKQGDYEKAFDSIKEGNEMFKEGHKAHAELITMEASGKPVQVSLILMHAEDQLMNADSFKIIAIEMIDLYKKIDNKG